MRFWDSLTNIITGMGTPKAKSFATAYGFTPMSPVELEAAYRGSWLARKVIDIPAWDMCREWRDWQADNDEIEAIEAEEIRLNLRGKVLEAKIKARLYGGAAIIIGDGTNTPSEPLQPERIGLGGIKYLAAISCQRLTAGELDTDLESPWFGMPQSYTLQSIRGAQVVIHPSRVVRFIGNPVPDIETAGTTTWGDSVLEAVGQALKAAEATAQNVADMTHEAKIDVLKVPNLMSLASDPEYSSRFQARTSLAMLSKSLNNTLLLDKEEEWAAKQLSFATLPEVMDRQFQIAAGAADIPFTRLMGASPGGLQSTGKGEEKDYGNRIRSGQELELRPAMATLDECLIWSALGRRPKEIHYIWSELFQMDEKDRAEINLKNAQAFQIDVNSGLMPDSAMAKARVNQLVENGVYPGLEAAMDEAEAEGDAIDFSEKASAAEEAAAAALNAPPEPAQVQRLNVAANDKDGEDEGADL